MNRFNTIADRVLQRSNLMAQSIGLENLVNKQTKFEKKKFELHLNTSINYDFAIRNADGSITFQMEK